MKAMTIGALARSAGVHVETIRFYQRRGLLPEPKRPPRGVRRYGPAAAARLRFIRRAQETGFTLDEVADLLRLERGCRGAHELAVSKLATVERRILDLSAMRDTLRSLVARCEVGGFGRCPIIAAFADGAPTSA